MRECNRRGAETHAEGGAEMRIDEFRSRNVPKGEQHDPLSEAVIGALIEVHRELGPGLTEHMYEEAVCHELDLP